MMRKFSIADFSSKKAAEQALLDVLNPLKPFYSESGARIHVGVTSTHYENDTIPMEAFARPLWGLVPFWTGGGSDAEFEELYRKGLEAGSDPSHPDYWHTCRDYDQKFCEMAAIAFGMLSVRKRCGSLSQREEKTIWWSGCGRSTVMSAAPATGSSSAS